MKIHQVNSAQEMISRVSYGDVIRSSSWISYLILTASASFLFGGFFDQVWLLFGLVFYVWLCIYVASLRSGSRFNRRALTRARIVVLLMVFSALWLFAQLVLPMENPLLAYLKLVEESDTASWGWFNSEVGWSSAPDRGFRLALSEIFFVTVLVASISIIDTRARLKQFMLLLSLTGLVHASIGLVALYGGIHLIEIQKIDGHWGAARGLFVNRNHFAALLVICLAGSFAQLIYATSFAYRQQGRLFSRHLLNVRNFIAVLCLVVSLIALIESQSRGALLGLIVGALIYIRVRANWFILLSFCVLLVIIFLLVGDELIARLGQGFLSFGERSEQWRVSVKAISNAPFLGYGGGSYATVFQIFREHTEFRDVIFSQAHNLYLHMWLERGVFGLLFWLSVLVIAYKKLHSAMNKSVSLAVTSSLRAGGIVLTAALVQSLVDYNLQVLNIRYFFFCVLGVVFAAPLVYQSSRKSTFSN